MIARRAGGLIAAALLAAGGGPARAAEPYDIDVILSLSGQGTFVGRSQAQTIGAAETVINRAGGINGRPVRFVIQDDRSDPVVAVQLFNGIVAKHVPVVLGPGFAAPCNAVLPLVKADIVQYCLAPSIHPAPGAYSFSTAVSTTDLAAAGLRYLRLRGWTKLAVIDSIDATGQDGDRVLRENLARPENGAFKVVAFEHFIPTDASIAPQMWRIKFAGAQAIFAWVTGRPFGMVLAHAFESKIDVPILTNEDNISNLQMAYYRSFLPRQVFFTGVRFLGRDPVGPPPVRDAQRRFASALRAKGVEADIISGTAWDPAMVLVDALRHAGNAPTAKAIHDYIEALHGFAGIDGVIDFRDGSQRGLPADTALIVRWNLQKPGWIAVSKPEARPFDLRNRRKEKESTQMLTSEENERLTRVGPGTPMGKLLRRYWQPVAGVAEMESRWTKRVGILGEELVLYKDRSGAFGLIAEACPHRRASLAYGIPTANGIRCPYHGWMFDGTGRCLEQPNEPENSNFKDKIVTSAYPVGELGGMLWAYLGPLPAPLIPRYDGFVDGPAIRHIGQAAIPCNWLQMMENSVDIVHTEWLHGKYYEFLKERDGVKVAIGKHHKKIAFDEFPYGIIKRRLMEGQSEDSDDWKVGHPLVFPNMLAVGSGGGLWKQYTFQIRVPIDDTHTQHWWYHAFVPPAGAEGIPAHLLDRVPVFDVPFADENGDFLTEYIHAQDIMAWVTQGPIADRTREALNSTDRGVTMLRAMLRRELEKVEAGQDPMATLRDPAQNACINLPLEKGKDMFNDGFESLFRRHMSSFSPIAEEIIEIFRRQRTPEPVAR